MKNGLIGRTSPGEVVLPQQHKIGGKSDRRGGGLSKIKWLLSGRRYFYWFF
jgi:hypothetical protein